jgi:RNA polymerase sigma factor (TIGR02999 family)
MPAALPQPLECLVPGDPAAQRDLDALAPELYRELRRLAAGAMARERRHHTLQPTALVHEAYLRLVGGKPLDLSDRRRFLALAGRVMRQVLVDHARGKRRVKRGSGATLVPLTEAGAPDEGLGVDVLALDQVLTRLEQLDPRQVRIVELRFWAGLEVEEVAEVLELSTATVKRETRMARAWLKKELEGAPGARV